MSSSFTVNLTTGDMLIQGNVGVGTTVARSKLDVVGNIIGNTTDRSIFSYSSVLDLGAFNSAFKGFRGGFTDGQYAYFVPNNNGVYHGNLVRIDLQNFTTSGVTSVDVASVNAAYKGFVGGYSNGRYAFLVPEYYGVFHGNLVRVDLQNFTTSGVTNVNVESLNAAYKGFVGGFTDGRYAYMVPDNNGARHGNLIRIDIQNFSTSGVTNVNVESVNAAYKGFNGGFTDGSYAYLVPNSNGVQHGNLVRVDLQNFTTSGVTGVDLSTVNVAYKGFSSGFTDGRYGYLVPGYNTTQHGNLVRVDLQNFSTSGVANVDVGAVNGAYKGFSGGFTDGRYGYLVPNYNGSAYHGNVVRVDLQNFTASGVTNIDVGAINAAFKGFQGGFSDGRYGYLVPFYNGSYFGNVVRIDVQRSFAAFTYQIGIGGY